MRNRHLQAFTLIELMIVIAIIAILAGIMVPNFVRARQEAQLASCKENLQSIGKAVELYLVRHTQDELNTNCMGAIDDNNPLVEEGYLAKAIKCPTFDDHYYLGCNSNTGVWTVYHNGPAHVNIGFLACYPEYSSFAGVIDEPLN